MFISSKEVIHSVAKNLKYYIDVQRKEDGFDLSGIDRSQQLYPNLKPLPILCVERLYDRSLKHYFNDPNIKTTLQMTFGKTVEEQERKLHLNYIREMRVERIIKKKMSKCSFSNFNPGDAFNLENLKTIKRNRIHRCPKILHQVPPPDISRSEVLRLISSASKVIVATEVIPQNPNKKHSPKIRTKLQVDKPSEIKPKWTEYEVTVQTGSCLGSDSKADIFINFYGEEDKVENVLLCNSLTNRIPFQECQTDVFLVEIPNVGKLQYIIIGHDREEPGCGCYLEDIIIKDCSNSVTWVFHCNTWFSSQAYGELAFQKFMPYCGQLDDRENVQKNGQNETSKQNTEIGRSVSKATSRSTKKQPQTVLNKKSTSCGSIIASEGKDNSCSALSCPRQSFRSQSTSTLSTDSRCEALNKSLPKSFSKGQIEFCLLECQNSLAESPERWPASAVQLKNQNVSKEVDSIDNGNNINKENTFQSFACISSDERKVTTKESLNADSQYSEKIQPQLPVTCKEDVEKSNLSEKEWSEGSPKYTTGVPHFVHGCLKTTESKSQISGTQSPHENMAATEDDNNLANMKQKPISFIHDIVGNTELPQKGNVTTERSINPVPSTMSNLESLQNSKVTLDGGIEYRAEPKEHSEEDQFKEAICEESKTEHPLKKGIAATKPSDCDTRSSKLTDKKPLCSTKENETNINCIDTDGVNLCIVFKNALRTIENGEYDKLENLCQRHSGLSSYRDDDGRTLLHIAAIYGNAEICQVLFQDPGVQKQLDSQDKEGRTALHYGILHSNKRIKRLLLNHGAQSDIPDHNLDTALDLALNMINEEEVNNN
ncbi:uncharacterized protein LOC121287976 [Carcharodon carcharias]|uniref:uncharacterized protein LOC121287976 n=1 Tax=Carcharodon carcharias TaxID=13397 RepID=UPI001B7E2AC0|nr:uncharacterized protein LOC121287976 [Carcharodon carcharias]